MNLNLLPLPQLVIYFLKNKMTMPYIVAPHPYHGKKIKNLFNLPLC
jgi:hypothetical protein